MTREDIRAGVIATIQSIAPEVGADELASDRPLRTQVDLDSMDWLNVILGLHRRFGVDIPEVDYAQLDTLDHVVAYLNRRVKR